MQTMIRGLVLASLAVTVLTSAATDTGSSRRDSVSFTSPSDYSSKLKFRDSFLQENCKQLIE